MNAHRACDDFHRTRAAAPAHAPPGARPRRGRRAGALPRARRCRSQRVLEAAAADAAAAPERAGAGVGLPAGRRRPARHARAAARLRPLRRPAPQAEGRRACRSAGTEPRRPPLARRRASAAASRACSSAARSASCPGIDYSNPDLSHFHSRHFWETGLITDRSAPGWLGRWLDRAGGRDNPLQGVSMGYGLSPVMRSGRAPVAAVASPGDAGFWIRGVWGDAYDDAMAAYAPARPRCAAAATRWARRARRRGWPSWSPTGSSRTPSTTASTRSPRASPTPRTATSATRLRYLAAMISKPLGIRVADVEADGDFDTHDNQAELTSAARRGEPVPGRLPGGPRGARRSSNRVLTFVWSEFGRRPGGERQRHRPRRRRARLGAGRPRARPGMHSEYPDLNRLDREDNLQVTIDFRRVYSSLLEQHLGTDASGGDPARRQLRPRRAGAVTLALALRGRRCSPPATRPRPSASASASGASRSTAAGCRPAGSRSTCATSARTATTSRSARASGRVLGALGEMQPGRHRPRCRVRLRKPGRYVVFCSLEGHEAQGHARGAARRAAASVALEQPGVRRRRCAAARC